MVPTIVASSVCAFTVSVGANSSNSARSVSLAGQVQQLHQAVLVHHDVGRLQVAVNDAGRVSPAQGIGDLDAYFSAWLSGRPVRGNYLVERLAGTYSMAMKSTPPD